MGETLADMLAKIIAKTLGDTLNDALYDTVAELYNLVIHLSLCRTRELMIDWTM